MNRKVRNLSLALLVTVSGAVNAQTSGAAVNQAQQSGVAIKSVRFVDALLNKWIAEI